MQAKRNTTILVITGLTSAWLFGAATPASKALLNGISAQTLAGLLYIGAALGVLPIVIRQRPLQPFWTADPHTVRRLAGAVVLGGMLGPLLLLLALRLAHAGSVSLWLNLELVATVVLGHFVFREHLTPRGWISAGTTIVAAVLLAHGEGGGGILAVGLISCACICWGLDNHFTALIDGLTPAQVTLWKGIVAGVFNLTMGGLLAGGIGRPAMIFMALLVGAVSYGFSITLYVTTAQGLGASRSQIIFSTAPFFGLLLSVLILGEAFTASQALAGGLMVVAMATMLRETHVHLHRHVPMSHQHLHGHEGLHHNHEHDGATANGPHVHWHTHDTEEHDHKHWPDLHHRHGHDDGDDDTSEKSDA